MSKINTVDGFLKACGTRRHQQGMSRDRAVTSRVLFGSDGNELGGHGSSKLQSGKESYWELTS